MNDHGSALVAAAEQAWVCIQEQHTDVPDVVIRLGVSEGPVLGHFAAHRVLLRGEQGGTAHEVMLSALRCGDGGRGAFATLLHEATHAACFVRGVKDTSRQGRYHNKRFQKCAVEFGLTCEHLSDTHGLAKTDLSPDTEAHYDQAIVGLEDAIRIYQKWEPALLAAQPRTSKPKAVCPCNRQLSVTPAVLAIGPILCGLCGDEFAITEEA